MVLMMMLTLIPANMAFAASDATVNTETTSADGTVNFDIEIEPTGTGFINGGRFEISLGDGAEWDTTTDASYKIPGVNPTSASDTEWKKVKVLSGPAEIVRVTDGRMELKINSLIDPIGDSIVLDGKISLDGAESGDQKVTIENIANSGVSRQVLTYAVVTGSGSVISKRLTDVEVLTRGTDSAAEFELRETNSKAIETGVLEMRLPKDIVWAQGTKVYFNDSSNQATLLDVETVAPKEFGNRVLKVDIKASDIDSDKIDRIIVEPKITITKDAKFGDIEVEFLGGNTEIDADDLKIAEYKDFGITMTVDKVESIVAGKTDTTKGYVVEVSLDPAGESFIAGRPIDFTVAGGDVQLKTNKTEVSKEIKGDYDDEFEVTIGAGDTSKEFKFELYLKADWDAAGELTLTGKGGGMEEQTVKLADVLAAAKITTKVDANKTVADVVVGLQNQATPEITITETEAGSLQEGYYVFDLNQARYSGVEFIDSTVKFETTGDISVDDVYTIENGEKVVVYVDGESNKEASSIIIKGLTVTLDRAVPFGQLDLRFGAVVADGAQDLDASAGNEISDGEFGIDPEKKGFDYEVETVVEKVPFLNVVTEVQTARQQKTVFTIDSATYTVGSETKTLDAAPYISNNRTMLPIGTVAQLAGATLNYSPVTRTAVFTKDNLVVSMNLDTNILLVNGSPVPMDAKPEIVNGRAFVSVVYVAQAFGIQNGTDIVYDAATRTVTLFPNAQ